MNQTLIIHDPRVPALIMGVHFVQTWEVNLPYIHLLKQSSNQARGLDFSVKSNIRFRT